MSDVRGKFCGGSFELFRSGLPLQKVSHSFSAAPINLCHAKMSEQTSSFYENLRREQSIFSSNTRMFDKINKHHTISLLRYTASHSVCGDWLSMGAVSLSSWRDVS